MDIISEFSHHPVSVFDVFGRMVVLEKLQFSYDSLEADLNKYLINGKHTEATKARANIIKLLKEVRSDVSLLQAESEFIILKLIEENKRLSK